MILRQEQGPKFAFAIHVIMQTIRLYCGYCTSGGHNEYSLRFMRFLIAAIFMDICEHDGVSGLTRYNVLNAITKQKWFKIIFDSQKVIPHF